MRLRADGTLNAAPTPAKGSKKREIQTLALFMLNNVPAKARRMRKLTLVLANPPPREKAPMNNEPTIKQAPVDDNYHCSQFMGIGKAKFSRHS